jgi:glutamate-1-semialdehyde 2,1-aminomutase
VSDELWSRALARIPGGVNSPVRSFASVGSDPFFVARGEGAFLVATDGTRYVDYVQSWGASILGHAHPAVVAAGPRAAAAGTSFGAPTRAEVELAEAVADRVASVQKLRLVSSGTEAAMSVLRLARGVTGRDRVVKFDGCYHGHADALLAGAGTGVAMLGLPGSAGVTRAAVADTVVVPFNTVPELDESVACVIVEPVAANMNLVDADPGFLEGLRSACDRVGALLIFDEVISGFRLGPGGATERSGVTPDLWCFGKVMGGGLPVGAFGGRAELMAALAPQGPVYQAGTLSGNPLATAAGHAVLGHVGAADYRALAERAARFAVALEAAIRDGGLGARVGAVGPLVGLLVGRPGEQPPVPHRIDDVRAVANTGAYAKLFHALLERGVALPPGPYEILFPGMAHGDAELDAAVSAAGEAAAEVARNWG